MSLVKKKPRGPYISAGGVAISHFHQLREINWKLKRMAKF